MDLYVNQLIQEFTDHKDDLRAERQKAYMKGHFVFFGLTSPLRKEIQRSYLLRSNLPPKAQLNNLVKSLWNKPERELQYFAQELVYKFAKEFEREDISFFEHMITHKSWWDTVDYISSNILGSYFKAYPETRMDYVDKWLTSNNIWLQRSALLFQLKYKDQVDNELLSKVIHTLLGSKEFFINKAIGWSLRQYGKFNPNWVIDFVDRTPLESLSRREALKLIG
jgi:3-methyladenine DNA glycosylase AlkD